MVRRLALVVALVLLLSFAAWRQQSAPITVTCGQAAGGQLMTAKGVDLAGRAGTWVRNIIDKPDVYRDPQTTRELLDGMFRKVLWYWVKTGVQSARGEKIDPQIIKLQEEADQARADAAAACCPALPAPQDEPPAETPGDEWDPRSASLSYAQGFSRENLEIARVVVTEQRRAGLPARASVVAVAAAMQESGPNGPRNLDHGHSSSVGAWQLIDSHGTKAQRMDPTFSVRWFYRQLKGVRGWEQMSVNDAAWRVEQPRADLRGLYGQHEAAARRLLASVPAAAIPEDPEAPGYTAGGCTPVGETVSGSAGSEMVGAPTGWDFPGQRTVDQAIAWMQDQDARNTGGWQARCLAAVGQAYGHPGTTPVAGHFYATGQWDAMPTQYRSPGVSDPPRGALVFWNTGSAAGHIAISNGDGRVWTTDPPGRTGQIGLVDIDTIDTWGTRLGHGAPYFIGKTGQRP